MSAPPVGFLMLSPCGRAWFVLRQAVRDDYARFLVEQDGLTPEAAKAQAEKDPGFLEEWLGTQFSWSEIASIGVLVREASRDDIRRALDLVRDNGPDPGSCLVAVDGDGHALSETALPTLHPVGNDLSAIESERMACRIRRATP